MESAGVTRALQQKDATHLIHPMTLLREHEITGPLVIVRGEGCIVYDSDGQAYLDSLAGLWNCTLGHGRRDVIQAVAEQMERISYVTTFGGISNDATIAWAEQLAGRLPGDLQRVFPNLTGSEANDTAFKFARMYFGLIGKTTKVKIFSHHTAYHGAALGVVNATGITEYWKRFMPLPANHVHVPAPHCYRCPYGKHYPDCDVLCAMVLEQMMIAEDPDAVAIFVAEPILGGGGVVIPKPEYYRRVREICSKYDVLFVDDEVITGFGRTGTWFGIEHWGVVPDMMTMGKGMTAGYLPMFATAVSQKIYRALADSGEILHHGFTYTGQPVLAAAALKVMEILDAENLVQRVYEMGRPFGEKLQGLLEYPWVGDVRSLGLIGAIEFVVDKKTRAVFPRDRKFGARLTAALREHGILSRVVRGHILVLAPPFIISEAELDALFQGIRMAIEDICPSL